MLFEVTHLIIFKLNMAIMGWIFDFLMVYFSVSGSVVSSHSSLYHSLTLPWVMLFTLSFITVFILQQWYNCVAISVTRFCNADLSHSSCRSIAAKTKDVVIDLRTWRPVSNPTVMKDKEAPYLIRTWLIAYSLEGNTDRMGNLVSIANMFTGVSHWRLCKECGEVGSCPGANVGVSRTQKEPVNLSNCLI